MKNPPWKAAKFENIWTVTTDRGDRSEEYDLWEDCPEYYAKLQAKAPELLEMCKELVQDLASVGDYEYNNYLIDRANKLIKEVDDERINW